MNRKILFSILMVWLSLGLFVLVGCASKTVQQQPEATVVSQVGMPQLYIWPNRNSHSNNEATLHLAVKVGSLQEEDQEQGYAHFVEHMAFNGTRDFPGDSLQQRLNDLGLDIGQHSNAYTSFDHTLYTISLNTVNPQRLDEAMELLAQWAYHIEFSPEEVDKERAVIIEEWRQSRPAEGRVSEQLEQAYFSGSRYADRLPIGKLNVIESASSETLKAFYQRWYHPENMAIIAAGDFDAAELKEIFNRHFTPMSAQPEHKLPAQYRINSDAMADFQTATDPFVASGYVDLSYFTEVTPVRSEQDLVSNLAMQAALTIWYQRTSAQLVASQGKINWVDYYWDFIEEDLLQVVLSAEVNQGDFRTGLHLLEQERLRLITQGVTQNELNDWRASLLKEERSEQDSASHLAKGSLNHFLMQWPMVGQQRWVQLLENDLPFLEPDDIKEALAQVTATQPKIRIVHPQSQVAPKQDQVANWLADVATSVGHWQAPMPEGHADWSINPANSGYITETIRHDNAVVEWTLNNGITVMYRYSDQAPRKVYYDLTGLGGLNALDENETLVARLATPTLAASGLRQMNGPELDQWLTSKAIEQHPYVNYFQRGMTGAGPSVEFPLMMRLLHIGLTEGRVDPDTWNHIKAQNEAHLEQVAEHPHRAWSEMLEQTLFDQDPALRAMTHAELASITPERMQALYNRFYSGTQNYSLSIVGDIDQALVEQSILASIATLPAKGADPCPCRNYPSPSADAEQHITGSGERQATVVLRYAIDKPSHNRGDALNQLRYLRLWLERELMNEIREEQGLVYALDVDLDGLTVFQNSYTLIVAANTDPEKVGTLVSEIESTLSALVHQPPAQEAIEQWQRTLSANAVQRLNRASTQADALGNIPLYGTTIASVFNTADSWETPSPEALAEQLSQFMAENAVRLELAWLP